MKRLFLMSLLAILFLGCQDEKKPKPNADEQGEEQATEAATAEMVETELSVSDFYEKQGKERERLIAYYGNLTQEQEVQIDNAVVDEMVRDCIMGNEYSAIGLMVTEDELLDQIIGEEPHPAVALNFTDAYGNFDRQMLENYLEAIETAPDQYRNAWTEFKNEIKKDRLETKFGNLVKASFYVPKRLAEKYYENRETKVSADVVALLYTAIPDSEVTVTDQDYKDYYEENKYRFETDETRSIEYVVFDVSSSQLANQFVADNKTYDQFNAAIEKAGLNRGTQKILTSASPGIPGLIDSREIVRWAFNGAKVGDVKKFDFEDRYVVAALTDIIPEGYVPLDKVKEQIEAPIRTKKKVEKCVEKMKAYGTDYARMEEELGAQSAKVELSLDSRGIGMFGTGSEVIGAIMGMKEGDVLGPVAGDQAAFIIRGVKPMELANAFDYNMMAREKKSQFNNRVQGGTVYNTDGRPYVNGGIYVALRNAAKIKDNRTEFY